MVECVHRAITVGDCVGRLVADTHLDSRLANMLDTIPVHGDVECLQVKCRLHPAKRLANEQRQGPFRTLVIVAEVLLLLDLGQDACQLRRVVVHTDAHFLGLHHDVAATRQVAHKNPALVANSIRSRVLKTLRHFLHSIHMHPALVGKGRCADPRLTPVRHQVGHLVHKT